MKIEPTPSASSGGFAPTGVAHAGPAARTQPPSAPPTAQLKAALQRMNAALKAMGSDVKFTFDPAAREAVIQVVDPATQKVIRQIPSRDALALAQALDRLQGLLVNERA